MLQEDTDAGRRVGEAARQACYAQYARHRRRVSAVKVGRFAQAAYNKAFKGEMQRQFDSQTELSKCGDTTEVLLHVVLSAVGVHWHVSGCFCQLAGEARSKPGVKDGLQCA